MVRLLLVVFLAPLAVSAADDPRVSILEQEVRNLQRQVQALSRQIDDLRTRPDKPAPRVATVVPAAPAAAVPQWLDASKWHALRRGMSEIDVIGSLGPPTTVRAEGGGRVLLYALELGGGAFLGGSIIFRERAVAEIHEPRLQ